MILVFGDSHVGCISWRFKDLTEKADIKFDPVHGANWGAFELTETPEGLHVFADRVPGHNPLDLHINGGDQYYFSSPLHSAPFYRDPAWRSFCPWTCSIDSPDHTPVSDATIEAWVDTAQARRMELLVKMKARGFDVTVVEPPKPLQRRAHGSTKPSILRRVDEMVRNHITKRLQDLDVGVIEVPEHTVSDGFTLEAFSSENLEDPHHGSRPFYKLMLDKIIQDGAS